MSHKNELAEHIEIIYEAEKIATAISRLKSKNIALDKQRQKNMEALRAISNQRNSDDIDNDSMWIDCSGTMIKLTLDCAQVYLKQRMFLMFSMFSM